MPLALTVLEASVLMPLPPLVFLKNQDVMSTLGHWQSQWHTARRQTAPRPARILFEESRPTNKSRTVAPHPARQMHAWRQKNRFPTPTERARGSSAKGHFSGAKAVEIPASGRIDDLPPARSICTAAPFKVFS